MSGTSADGIDVAAADLRLGGEALVLVPLGHRTTPYSPVLAADLAAALPPATAGPEAVCRLGTAIGQEFAAAAAAAVADLCGGAADLVVSHGQTLFHWVERGRARGTLQVGQPAWIAERTGLPVVSDLRSRDIAAGGQGAPLVAIFDVLLLGAGPRPRAALNLGGIANLTVVPPDGQAFAFDAGPANALIDAAVAMVSGGAERFDAGGGRARRGRVDDRLLAVLVDDAYYRLPPPKSTGKERFNAGYLQQALTRARVPTVAPDDLVATVTAHAAAVAADACVRSGVAEVVVSGGGTANPALMEALARRLGPTRLRGSGEWGIPAEAKEAYAFAVLGFLTVHGLPGALPGCTGASRATVLGSITPGAGPLALPPPAPVPPVRLVVAPGGGGADGDERRGGLQAPDPAPEAAVPGGPDPAPEAAVPGGPGPGRGGGGGSGR